MFLELFNKLNIDSFPIRKRIEAMEWFLRQQPYAITDAEEYGYQDELINGLYYRKIKVRAGDLIIGLVHKKPHDCFLLSGTASILSEDVSFNATTPLAFKAGANTKKIGYAHTEFEFMTVHKTNKKYKEDVRLEIFEESDLHWCDQHLVLENLQ